MKGKRIWKQWLCAVLMVALLCTIPEVAFSAQDETVVEWTYDDSILVNIMVDESRSFSPEDFPGIDCKKVFIMGKSQLEQGFRYELVLLLDVSNNTDLEKTIEKVQQLPMVDSAMRNRKYAPAKAILALDRLCIYQAQNIYLYSHYRLHLAFRTYQQKYKLPLLPPDKYTNGLTQELL